MSPAGRLTDTHRKYYRLHPIVDGKPFKILSTEVTRLIQHFIFFTMITGSRTDLGKNVCFRKIGKEDLAIVLVRYGDCLIRIKSYYGYLRNLE